MRRLLLLLPLLLLASCASGLNSQQKADFIAWTRQANSHVLKVLAEAGMPSRLRIAEDEMNKREEAGFILRIDPSGRILSGSVPPSSRQPALDSQRLAKVTAAGAFPTPPASLPPNVVLTAGFDLIPAEGG
jgi:hypothetical protein